MLQRKETIRPVTYGLAIYFVLMATDCFRLGGLGSFLKIVAFVPLLLALLDLRKLRIHFSALVVTQLLFWLLTVLSIFYSINQDRTITSVLTLTLNLALILILGAVEAYSSAEIDLLQRAMLYGSWLTVILMLVFSDISSDGRLSLQLGEVVQDQNYINGYMLYAFSYHCDVFLRQRKKRHLLLAFVLLGIELLTGSRGAFLAFAAVGVAHMLLLLRHSNRPARNILLLMVVCVLAGIFFEFILDMLPESVAVRFSWEFISQTGTIGRSKIWVYLLEHFSKDTTVKMLFGHGYGTSAYVNRMNGLVAHNLYLDNLITLGIVGVVLQLASQIQVFSILVRQRTRVLLCTYIGLLAMCMSLSLVAYKPIWNVMLLALILQNNRPQPQGDSGLPAEEMTE